MVILRRRRRSGRTGHSGTSLLKIYVLPPPDERSSVRLFLCGDVFRYAFFLLDADSAIHTSQYKVSFFTTSKFRVGSDFPGLVLINPLTFDDNATKIRV